MSKLKEMLAMGSLAMATAVHPLPTARAEPDPSPVKVQQTVQDIIDNRIVNEADDPFYTTLLTNQLKTMAQTKIGADVLSQFPTTPKWVIKSPLGYAREGAYYDYQDCVIYDDTLISTTAAPSVLLAHEMRHAIQEQHYASDYQQMPTEQIIVYNKMIELEARLQNVLMKEELYEQKALGTRTSNFVSTDWQDYRRIKADIARTHPNVSAKQQERMARTRFVVDSWQGNDRADVYDKCATDKQTIRGWSRYCNEFALGASNNRLKIQIPPPDLTVDPALTARHHANMQEFIQRMGIDVPADFFDTLKNDKSLQVVRDPQALALISRHLGQDLSLVVMPRDDNVRVGGIAVAKDNATRMFSPGKRKLFQQEIQAATLARKAQVAGR